MCIRDRYRLGNGHVCHTLPQSSACVRAASAAPVHAQILGTSTRISRFDVAEGIVKIRDHIGEGGRPRI